MKTVDKGVRVDQDLTGKTHSDWIVGKKRGLMFKYFRCIVTVKNAYAIANRETV
jgi:membrane dipeptidase